MGATAGSALLPERLVVWRRFDATDPAHFDTLVIDEGTGQRHLKGGALRFDHDGCSIFRHDVLERLGLAPDDITTSTHSALAFALRADVEAFRSPFAVSPDAPAFRVRADPLDPPPGYMPAHGLIQHLADYPSNSKRRRAEGELARQVFMYRPN